VACADGAGFDPILAAVRPHHAARRRGRAHALARHVHGLRLTGHAWHYEMPGLRSRARVQAEQLAEYLVPVT
jgi:hypothetical protein